MSAWREYAPTAAALLYALSTCRYGFEWMVAAILVPAMIVWIPRMAWVAWRQPSRRMAQGIKFGIVIATIVSLSVLHGVRERRARAAAAHVTDVINAYRMQHGAYPDSLGQAGIDAQPLKRWWLNYYKQDGHASLFYGTALNILDTWAWDFDKPGWQFHPD